MRRARRARLVGSERPYEKEEPDEETLTLIAVLALIVAIFALAACGDDEPRLEDARPGDDIGDDRDGTATGGSGVRRRRDGDRNGRSRRDRLGLSEPTSTAIARDR